MDNNNFYFRDVPPEEEESYVDAEMLTNYAADPDTKKYPCNLAERKQFFVWGPLAQLNSAKLAHFQKQELVIGNTLKSIVDSSADKIGIAKERINKHHKPMIKWSEKTSIIDFVMDPPEQVLQKTEIRDGKLQNIRKEDAAKRE
uniref:Uncharacterized protein n=1 Tax=Caenorhabditis japonica TaxID=281687 RepID=A0A8R1EBL1_CAEJA